MTVTRSKTGRTPRYVQLSPMQRSTQFVHYQSTDLGDSKTEHPGFVETPTPTPSRQPRLRSSGRTPATTSSDSSDEVSATSSPTTTTAPTAAIAIPVPPKSPRRRAAAPANGAANGAAPHPAKAKVVDGWRQGDDPRVDHSGHKEFGGAWGVSAMMLFFPLLMWYMWIGATYYDGRLPLPAPGQSVPAFARHLCRLVYTGAFPSPKAWAIYWAFFLFEAACYVLLPGVTVRGKPLPHAHGRQLEYYCSGVPSFYTTIAVVATLHLSGLFPLYTLLDDFGPLLSVAILTGYLVSVVAYASALYRGAEHRMTGSLPYDFFMGAELNPRMFGILDFKMFSEVRLPWYILFLISCAAAARQYEQLGWVSPEVGFLVMAHFLYANACSKGEELIPPTWYVSL